MGFALMSCSSKLPDPTPLADFSVSAILDEQWSAHPNDGNEALLFKLSPASDDDFLYVAGNNGEVSAINSLTGKKFWATTYHEYHFSSHVGLNSEAIYLGTDTADVVKLDKKTGALLWAKSAPSTVIAAPLAVGDKVFVKSINGEVTSLNAQTGTPVWNYQQTLPSLILRDASDSVAYDQLLLVGFSNGVLIAFEQLSGNIRWIKQVSTPEGKTDVERMADIAATPQMRGNVVYAATYQGKMVAFDLRTQDTLWAADVSTYNDFSLSNTALFDWG
ncbi:MAG: PQQ-binding-like beta-propeller repeat protein [Gammaproteobacteria bacterium]|nr:PQQ-binding-like beta-propeller repeat protein [Gammaproteobacteria bacterium]